jgi:hypothetical protein
MGYEAPGALLSFQRFESRKSRGLVSDVDSDPSSGGGPEDEAWWWCDPQEVIDFAHVLVDAEELGDCQHAVIDFFEKPWKWDREHRVWRDNGRPDLASAAQFDALIAFFVRSRDCPVIRDQSSKVTP